MLINGLSDTDRVRLMMPSYLLTMAADLAEQSGEYEFNPTMKENLETETTKYLVELDDFSKSRLAGLLDDQATAILSNIDVNNEAGRLLGTAKAIVLLGNQKKHDPNTVSGLAALGMVMESDDDNDPAWDKAIGSQPAMRKIIRHLGELGLF